MSVCWNSGWQSHLDWVHMVAYSLTGAREILVLGKRAKKRDRVWEGRSPLQTFVYSTFFPFKLFSGFCTISNISNTCDPIHVITVNTIRFRVAELQLWNPYESWPAVQESIGTVKVRRRAIKVTIYTEHTELNPRNGRNHKVQRLGIGRISHTSPPCHRATAGRRRWPAGARVDVPLCVLSGTLHEYERTPHACRWTTYWGGCSGGIDQTFQANCANQGVTSQAWQPYTFSGW